METLQGMGWPDIPTPRELWERICEEAGGEERLLEGQKARLCKAAGELLRRQRDGAVDFYRPYESRRRAGWWPQLDFHRSQVKVRLFDAGNRAGKSVAGFAEDVMVARGTHPYWKCVVPNHGWVVSLDYRMSTNVAERQIYDLVPKSEIAHWSDNSRVLTLKNGSTIGFRSCDQDVEKFGGVPLHWVHIDEEPPGDKGYRIYQECRMRLLDYRGRLWMTLTPVLGMSWTYDELFEMSVTNGGPDRDIEVFRASLYDNPHIPEDEIEKMERTLTEDERRMRIEGEYVQFAGRVYREFDGKTHVVPGFPVPRHWKRYRTIDHGMNNPTACLWVAVSERGELYVYDEYYETDKTVKENAEAIRSITAGDHIQWTTIDPSTDNRDPISGSSVRTEYRKHGVHTRALRSDKMQGINAIKQLLHVDERTRRPGLFVFDTCYNTIREFQRYRWKQTRGKDERNLGEEPAKVLDHAMDALRYLVCSRPRYEVETTDAQPATWSYGGSRHIGA